MAALEPTAVPTSSARDMQAKSPTTWRAVLPVHPAANNIPEASDDERCGLGSDLARHGLKVPVVLVRVAGGAAQLLDGRHRLDLLEGTGVKVVGGDAGVLVPHQIVEAADDAEAERLSLSLNAHRRHLPADEKRKLLRAQLVATPEKSDRAIGAIVGSSDKTVTKERRDLERRSEIPNVATKTDTKGRRQPRGRRRVNPKSAPKPDPSRSIKRCLFAVKVAVEQALVAKCGDAEHQALVFENVRRCLAEMEQARPVGAAP